jgi:hypothetical protein
VGVVLRAGDDQLAVERPNRLLDQQAHSSSCLSEGTLSIKKILCKGKLSGDIGASGAAGRPWEGHRRGLGPRPSMIFTHQSRS